MTLTEKVVPGVGQAGSKLSFQSLLSLSKLSWLNLKTDYHFHFSNNFHRRRSKLSAIVVFAIVDWKNWLNCTLRLCIKSGRHWEGHPSDLQSAGKKGTGKRELENRHWKIGLVKVIQVICKIGIETEIQIQIQIQIQNRTGKVIQVICKALEARLLWKCVQPHFSERATQHLLQNMFQYQNFLAATTTLGTE